MKPIKIGNIPLENNIFLAPLAGVTDKAFRVICKEMGAGLVCTEMISAKGVHYKSDNSIELAKLDDREKPAQVQIFGCEPEIIAEAAVLFESMGAEIIDINMGCPTPKITGNGNGSFLMTNIELAYQIMLSVVKAVNIPVTVKMRKGYKSGNETAVTLAKAAEAAGIKAITVHGRFADEFYRGKSDRNVIRKVKESVNIPVIGNGDILTPYDAKSMIEETGCDAIMIGRGALGNPWLIRDTVSYLQTGKIPGPPSKEEKLNMIKRHICDVILNKGEDIAIREMRKHIAWYIKGYEGSAGMRDRVFKTENKDELFSLLNDFFDC